MEDSFLPQDYEAPTSNLAYTKFEDNKTTRIRILSSSIVGWEYWDKFTSDTNKPIRLHFTEENKKIGEKESLKNSELKDRVIKHFWAFIVWNYETKRIEICEITQKTIMASLSSLIKDPDFGSPKNRYDLKITKTKDKDKTNYSILPGKETENTNEINEAFENTFIDLEALFYGLNPFDQDWKLKSVAEEIF